MIRIAKSHDAEQAIQVLRRSIEELCVSDHGCDQDILNMWLSNKTPEFFRSWLDSQHQALLVAERDGRICAVGGATKAGEITLNYISPHARFEGISKAMVAALELLLLDWGNRRAHLTSTATAHQFYHSVGYRDVGPPEYWGKLPGYPMEKIIS